MHRQSFIPGFPVGAIKVGKKLSILTKDGHVTYFVGGDNYYDHPEEDVQSKRFALSSLMENNHVRARDLEKELNIPHRTLMNWVKQYREFGCASFYRTIERVKPRVMNPAKNAECAELFAKGFNASEVARQAKVKESTLRKAKQRNAIPLLPKALIEDGAKVELSTKSERSRIQGQFNGQLLDSEGEFSMYYATQTYSVLPRTLRSEVRALPHDQRPASSVQRPASSVQRFGRDFLKSSRNQNYFSAARSRQSAYLPYFALPRPAMFQLAGFGVVSVFTFQLNTIIRGVI